MNGAALALVLASALYLRPQPAPPHDAPDRYIQQCASPAAASSEACRALRSQVEEVALRALQAMRVTRRPVPKPFLRACLRNEMPPLQATALSLFAREPVEAEDGAAIVSALNSPYPAVRRAALKVLPRAPGSDAAQGVVKRDYEKVFGSSARDPREYSADKVPDVKELGAPSYPGSQFVYLASGPRRAFFTSADSVAKVVAYYAKGGAKPMTLAELKAPRPKTKPDPSEIMRRVQAGEDPMKVVADLQSKAMGQSSTSEWTKGIDGEPGVEDAQFVQVSAAGVVGGQALQARAVGVYRDTVLGKTAIVFPRPAKAATAVPTSADAIQQQVAEQQAIAEPLPTFEAVDPTAP